MYTILYSVQCFESLFSVSSIRFRWVYSRTALGRRDHLSSSQGTPQVSNGTLSLPLPALGTRELFRFESVNESIRSPSVSWRVEGVFDELVTLQKKEA